VQFMATRAERTARSFKQKLEHAGYAAELTTSETNGKALYRLRITQLDSKAEAAGLAARMTAELKIAQPWVTTARIPGG
jgi:predicted transcriptional regulator